MSLRSARGLPPGIPRPMLDRKGVHDSPHGADMAQTHRAQTDCLIYKLSGGTRTWIWNPAPWTGGLTGADGPPRASISAADTWTTFTTYSSSDENLWLPWRFAEGHEKILVYTQLACDADVALKVRWDSDDLVDAVATATGEVAGPRIRPSRPMDTAPWRNASTAGGGRMLCNTWYSWLTPTVPDNRRISLRPYVKAPAADPRFDVSGTIEVLMMSVAVMDVPARDTAGW